MPGDADGFDGERHPRKYPLDFVGPHPKRRTGLSQRASKTKQKGTEWERERHVGRSDPAQRVYSEVSIEEGLGIPVRLRKCHDPPIFPDTQTRTSSLEANLGSVEDLRKLHTAIGEALASYDRGDNTRRPEEVVGGD